MKIEFITFPKELQPLVTEALVFYASKLMSKRLSNKIYLEIEGHRGLIYGYANALCTWEDDWYRPRDFHIEVNVDQKLEDLFITLAHEMVHVKQFARSEMRDLFYPEKRTMWFKESFSREDTDYWDLPWEVEAHGRERGLFVRFVETKKNHKKFGYGS
jgi:hypothetical protein